MARATSADGKPAVLQLLKLEASLRAGAQGGCGDDVVAALVGDPGLWPFAAALVAAHPGGFSPGVVEKARETVEAVARFNAAIHERVRPLFGAFEERQTRWAVVGTAWEENTAGVSVAGQQLVPLHLLIHPYDAPRARVTAMARGFRRTAEGRLAVRFEHGGAVVILETGLHPRGWPAIPLSPFLEGAEMAVGASVRRMTPAAAWAAQRLLVARELWYPSSVSPAQLVELAILARSVDSDDRETWAASVGRWGAGMLWKRCGELELWLAGGARPGWLDPSFGAGTPGFPVADRRPPFALGLALQDSPVRKVTYTFARLIGR